MRTSALWDTQFSRRMMSILPRLIWRFPRWRYQRTVVRAFIGPYLFDSILFSHFDATYLCRRDEAHETCDQAGAVKREAHRHPLHLHLEDLDEIISPGRGCAGLVCISSLR